MTLMLLIDLDNTLLSNDLQTFLPAYLQSLGEHLKNYAKPELLMRTLMDATRRTVENKQPNLTLKEVFDSAFYPTLGLQPQDMQEAITAFYQEVFPTLRRFTQPRPEAKVLVEQALSKGYEIVIATSPLFPRTAIIQRLEWAGISPNLYNFRLITSYENFHFCKPNPAYYTEILAQLGWLDGGAVMIGDDLVNDILPASRAGLPVFWIDPTENQNPVSISSPNGSGSLEEVLPWIEAVGEAHLQPNLPHEPDSLQAALLATPAALDSLVPSLPAEVMTKRPQEKEWCVTEVLCHLRDVESEVNLPRIRKLVEENNPFLPGMDTDRWAEERQYLHQDGHQALATFTEARMALLALLEQLDAEGWRRPARHAIFGPTHLKELVAIIAEHDRIHIQQIHATLRQVHPSV
jgi:HAD superfamily hydrolase (TIGR01549 family)